MSPAAKKLSNDARSYLSEALRLARRGYGATSPNPMVGAVLVKGGRIVGRGWHRVAGGPHAEIEAIRDVRSRGHNPRGATLYVTLEPCCTHGRTPPCTDALIAAGIKRVIVGTTDPNPKHSGKGLEILKRAGIKVVTSDPNVASECAQLNAAFNHWIVRRTPFVTVKAAMTLDGKIATATGEAKWITSERARTHAMQLRRGADAILVGVNTVLADDPALTLRAGNHRSAFNIQRPMPRRIVLDSMARTPPGAKVVRDPFSALTTVVVSKAAPRSRVAALAKRVSVMVAPLAGPRLRNQNPKLDLRWLLRKLGRENVTSLLVEGGGEVNASFLLERLAHRVAFFYAPMVFGGRDSLKAVAGDGVTRRRDILELHEVQWSRLGPDLLLEAVCGVRHPA